MDEDAPRPIAQFQPGQKLDDMSVDEIDATVAMLRQEIARLEAARKHKAAHLDAAAALFSRK